MAFSSQFLDELRARAPLAEIVGRRLKLTRKGSESLGLCPFHKEKTPSFYVYDDHYHCFGCQAHGSVIDFVMNTEGLSFPEAVERLAGEAGMEVPADTPEERQRAQQRQSLYDVLETVCAHFEKMLRLPEGGAALDYLGRRGLDDETISRFRLGFAVEAPGALKAALGRDGVGEDQLVAAGQLKRSADGRPPYQYFRGRVIFPITDRRGRVIAFGGRILKDGEPKYLNSPETALFSKGRVLYGLAQAAAAARKAGTLIVAEGYMDVIALARAGFENAVAPLGTALSEDQIAGLWRIVRQPVLCFDGDEAGRRAAAKAAERALPVLKAGYALRFAMLPPGEDPDSLIARTGAKAMDKVLANAVPLSEVLWRMESGGRTAKTPEERASLHQRMKDHARKIDDSLVRRHFLDALDKRLWPDRLKKRQGGRDWTPSMDLESAAGPAAQVDAALRRQQILLAVLVTHPELFDDVGERLGSLAFSPPELDKFRQEVLKNLIGDSGLDSAALERQLRNSGYSDALDSVLSPRVFEHAFFARPGTDPGTALEGWEETFALCRKIGLRSEIEEARRRLAEDTSAENRDYLRALKKEARQAVQDDGEPRWDDPVRASAKER